MGEVFCCARQHTLLVSNPQGSCISYLTNSRAFCSQSAPCNITTMADWALKTNFLSIATRFTSGMSSHYFYMMHHAKMGCIDIVHWVCLKVASRHPQCWSVILWDVRLVRCVKHCQWDMLSSDNVKHFQCWLVIMFIRVSDDLFIVWLVPSVLICCYCVKHHQQWILLPTWSHSKPTLSITPLFQ